jgi:L-ascorbate metabolism protein UlaG (beta-lactamase superfamily)
VRISFLPAILLLLPGIVLSAPRDVASDPPQHGHLTFWGHSSCYLELGGFGFAIDPVFEPGYSPIHRREVPPPPPGALDEVRIVLISHSHPDHLSPNTLETLPDSALVLCPPPAAAHVEPTGLSYRVMKPWEVLRFPGGAVVAIPALHPGGRSGLEVEASLNGGALGYIIHTRGLTLCYTGDTNYFEGMQRIGDRFHPDIVLLNLNAHLHGKDAAQAVHDLGDPVVIPIHWGAYGGTNAMLGPGWREDLRQRLGEQVTLLGVGQTLRLDRWLQEGGFTPPAGDS